MNDNLEIVPIDLLNVDGTSKLATTRDAFNVRVSEQLITRVRGYETLDFDIPLDADIVPKLNVEMQIYLYNNERVYIIRKIDKSKATDDICHVYCEALWYELLDGEYFEQPATDTTKYTLTQVINQILEGTDWKTGTIEPESRHAYTTEANSKLWALRYVVKVWGGEIFFDTLKKEVNVYTDYGERQDDVYKFNDGGNVSAITRTIDSQMLTTRVYMYGNEDLTIEEINGGLPYVEDFRWYDSQKQQRVIKSYTIEDDRFTDVYSMREYMLAYLQEYGEPIITYEMIIAKVGENTNIGDYAYIQDYDLELQVWTRALEKVTDYSNPDASTIVFEAFTNNLSSSTSGEGGSVSITVGGNEPGKDYDADIESINIRLNSIYNRVSDNETNIININQELDELDKTLVGNNDIAVEFTRQFEYPTSVATGTPTTHFMQGSCRIGDNVVFAMIITSTQAYGLDRTLLVERSLVTGETIRSLQIPLGHANTIAYSNRTNKLYIPNLFYYNTSGTQVRKPQITEIDYDDWTNTSNWYVNDDNTLYPTALSYDNETNEMHAILNLGTPGTYRFVQIDEETHQITNTDFIFETPEVPDASADQGMVKWKNYFIFCWSFPNQLFMYRIDTGEMVRRFSIGLFINDTNWSGELEDISHVEGSRFMLGYSYHTNNNNLETQNAFAEIDLVKNTFSKFENDYNTTFPTTSRIMYVDTDYTGAKEFGTPTHPFKNLQNAINVMLFNNIYSGEVRILRAGTYPQIYVNRISPPLLITNQSSGTVTISGARVFDCTAVRFQNINFTEVTVNGGYDACIECGRTRMILEDCYINGSNRVSYGVYLYGNSEVLFQGTFIDSVTGYGAIAVRAQAYGNVQTNNLGARRIRLGIGGNWEFQYARTMVTGDPNARIISIETADNGRAIYSPSMTTAWDYTYDNSSNPQRALNVNRTFSIDSNNFNSMTIELTQDGRVHYEVIPLRLAYQSTGTIAVRWDAIQSGESNGYYGVMNFTYTGYSATNPNGTWTIVGNTCTRINFSTGTWTREVYGSNSAIADTYFLGVQRIYLSKV